MCTYNITLNDALVERVRPAFSDENSWQRWLQEQVSLALERFANSQGEAAQQAMVKESLTTAFNELQSGQAKKNARKLFA